MVNEIEHFYGPDYFERLTIIYKEPLPVSDGDLLSCQKWKPYLADLNDVQRQFLVDFSQRAENSFQLLK